MEGQVPRGEPRVLPLVRHRDHVAGEEVEPRDVAQPAAGGVLAPRVDALLAQPAVDVVLVVLLAPQQPGERLAHDVRRVLVEVAGDDAGVEGVRLGDPLREHRVEVDRAAARVQPHPDLRRAAGRDLEHVVRGDLGAGPRRVDRVGARDHVVVDPVLRVRRAVRAGDPPRVRLVVAEQQLARRLEAPLAERAVRGARGAVAVRRDRRPRRPVVPGVAEPERRQQVQRRRLRPAVVRGDAHQQVVVVRLRVLDLHVEVAVVVEHAGVEQLVLEVAEAARAVRPQQVVVRVRRLRVLVDALHVRVRRRAVDVEVVLLDVLAVVALGVRQPEHPLLEDRVGAVPQREREAQPLLVVGTPAIPSSPQRYARERAWSCGK